MSKIVTIKKWAVPPRTNAVQPGDLLGYAFTVNFSDCVSTHEPTQKLLKLICPTKNYSPASVAHTLWVDDILYLKLYNVAQEYKHDVANMPLVPGVTRSPILK